MGKLLNAIDYFICEVWTPIFIICIDVLILIAAILFIIKVI